MEKTNEKQKVETGSEEKIKHNSEEDEFEMKDINKDDEMKAQAKKTVEEIPGLLKAESKEENEVTGDDMKREVVDENDLTQSKTYPDRGKSSYIYL